MPEIYRHRRALAASGRGFEGGPHQARLLMEKPLLWRFEWVKVRRTAEQRDIIYANRGSDPDQSLTLTL